MAALLRARLDLDGARGVLDEVDLGLGGEDAVATAASGSSLAERVVVDPLDVRLEVLAVEVEHEELAGGENEALVRALEDLHHLVRVKVLLHGVLLEPERDLEVHAREVDVAPGRLGVKRLDVDHVARLRQARPRPHEPGRANRALRDLVVRPGDAHPASALAALGSRTRRAEHALGGEDERALVARHAHVGNPAPVALVDDEAVCERVARRGRLDDGESSAAPLLGWLRARLRLGRVLLLLVAPAARGRWRPVVVLGRDRAARGRRLRGLRPGLRRHGRVRGLLLALRRWRPALLRRRRLLGVEPGRPARVAKGQLELELEVQVIVSQRTWLRWVGTSRVRSWL